LGRRIKMTEFEKSDKVRVRMDLTSPYSGSFGTVFEELREALYGFWNSVKFESIGFTIYPRI
jgi:hypothetical protein